MTSPYPRHVHASRTCSILSVVLHSLNATILSFLSLRLSQETSGRIDTDDVLCHLLRSLPSLRVLTWTDLDLPPRDEDDIDEFYWDSAINMRAWGESKLFAILDFMQQVINDQVYRHAVTRILAQCARCGFGINDIFLDFVDEEESEYEAA